MPGGAYVRCARLRNVDGKSLEHIFRLADVRSLARSVGRTGGRLALISTVSSSHINNTKSFDTCADMDDTRFMNVDPFINFVREKKLSIKMNRRN